MNAALPIGQILLHAGLIGDDQLRVALHEQLTRKLPLGRLLVELGFLSDAALRDALAQHCGHHGVELDGVLIDAAALAQLPQALARRHQLLPLHYHASERRLVVATANSNDVVALDRLRSELGADIAIELRQAAESELVAAIERHYGQSATVDELVREIEQRDTGSALRHGVGGSQAVVRLVDALLADAVAQGASDLHFEPEAGFVRVRYRIDGNLHQVRALHKSYWAEIAVRLKVLAALDIAESRTPQDGRISIRVGGQTVDLRIATLPTLHGENIVLRILDRAHGVLSLDALGLDHVQRGALDAILARPEGLTLVSGPTGSGKTTTLYAVLAQLNSEEVNIMTLEDPVEYPLPMVRQTQVGDAARLGFADGVRALLRQDPDILLVGEIRDADTAEMALRAALTGHRVFATVHANSALGAIPRLIDIGVRPELLAGNLAGILSQRLLRQLCAHCSRAEPASTAQCELLGVDALAPPLLRHPVGCPQCNFRGFRGRRPIMEILPVSSALDDAIASGASLARMRAAVSALGHRSLAADGVRQVLAGQTAFAELARAVDLGGRGT